MNIKSAEKDRTQVNDLSKELKMIGTSVMDVYTGSLSVDEICEEITGFLNSRNLNKQELFSEWTGKKFNDFRTITLSDTSQWILKYHNDKSGYVHIFPARLSPLSFRIKSNTLKSAILFIVLIGKDYISAQDLNRARRFMDLSPVKDPRETEAIIEMIEILRVS